MTGRELIARMLAPLVAKATEGAYRPGPYLLPVSGGWLSATAGSFMNWWQLGYTPDGMSAQSAMVEACVSAYAQTVAMCPGTHWRMKGDTGGRERVVNSALCRFLRRPNQYQSISDFLLNAVRSLYLEGNCYGLVIRNSRFEIDEIHLMDSRQCYPQVAVTGDVFYKLAGNDVIARQLGEAPLMVPARDVFHIRLHCDRKRPFPLKGDTPLSAALTDLAAGNAIQNQQIQFYLNSARPSAILSTDQILTREQRDTLRAQWNEMAKGLEPGCGPGGTPILSNGLKVIPWSTPGRDSQLAEMLKMSDEKIALAFRIPLAILGIGGMGTLGSTELLMGQWISSGLGFCLNHVEEAFGVTFNLHGQPDEYLEFDTSALLRSAFKDRIDGLVKAVQGGVLAPNEARELEGFHAVKFGDEPRVQQQVVPLSAAAGIPAAPRPNAQPPAPGPQDKPPPPEKMPRKDIPDARTILAAADRYERRLVA
jgi:HK97 family phage portal protein